MANISDVTYSSYCNNLPSQNVIASIKSYILQELKLSKLFGNNVYAYKRTDYQIQTLPALSVYPLPIRTDNAIVEIIGKIGIDIVLPISISRERVTESSIVLGEGIFIALRTQKFIDYMGEKVPALVGVSTNTTNNYSDLYEKESKAWYNVSIELDYEINYIIWMELMAKQGFELTDLCTQAALYLETDLSEILKE